MRQNPVVLEDSDLEPRNGVLDLASFALAAVARNRVLTAAVFVACVALLAGYYVTRTPMYRVETKVLTQRPQALPSAIRSTVQDDPTRSAYEFVHRRENLLALIKQTNLYPAAEGSVGADENALIRLPFFGNSQRPDNDLNHLVDRLDRDLIVTTNDGVITISIDWPDASQGYHLVQAAIQNFLETRHLQEITAIDEVVSALQGRVVGLRDQLDKVLGEAQRQAVRQEPALVRDEPLTPPVPTFDDEELAKLKALVDAKERAIQDVDEFRRRRLADLQAQLDEKRGVFTDAYPTVIALRQDIDALSKESPQILELREEHKRLLQQYLARLSGQQRAGARGAGPRIAARQANAVEQNDAVRDARFQYEQMLERLNTAQLELDRERAAFKYRYSVVWPAQVPTHAVSPHARKIFGLGLPVALAFAVLLATLLELRRGSVLRRWQVERTLGLPVLGELERATR